MPLWLLALPGIGGKVLDFLKSPLGILAIIAIAYLGGNWQGRRAADARCEARIQASIEAARQIDNRAAREALQSMERQKEAAIATANEADRKLTEYQNELANRPDAGCAVTQPDVERLRSDPPTGRRQVAPLPPKRNR